MDAYTATIQKSAPKTVDATNYNAIVSTCGATFV
jgi:hypothetical protein